VSERLTVEDYDEAIELFYCAPLDGRPVGRPPDATARRGAVAGGALRRKITLQQGITQDKAREIVRLIKDTQLNMQAAIQQHQVRVSGKSRDDLQAIIAMLRGKELGIAVQFENYRST
jgi:hypothetical protein